MARITFKNLEEYELRLSKMRDNVEKIAGAAIYEGAAIVTDEIHKGIEDLPIVSGYGTVEKPLPGGVTRAQKDGLLHGLGIAKMQEANGYYNVKVGFDGYNETLTKGYPNGQPNQLVARGVESGTSWKQKCPFVRPAINRSRKRAEAKMAQVIDDEIEKVMK